MRRSLLCLLVLVWQSAAAGMYGPYPMTRDASGTSWQPDSTPHTGLHLMTGDWMVMMHGFVTAQSNHQGGPRGDDAFFSANMFMASAQRAVGAGTLGVRGMVSLEPATIGPAGYPLLAQTGETADGKTHLIDRQHPHDLLMELALSYAVPVGEDSAIFGYAGYPGEPALGPPAFMHRFSGMDIPEAPLSHHWLDSTHITFGVGTAGYIRGRWKLEVSRFTGREPDQRRWNFDTATFDSSSARLSFNPTEKWALQASGGRLVSVEQLEPDVDQERFTASASYNHTRAESIWQVTAAWGQTRVIAGPALDAYLLESTLSLRATHSFLGRLEHVAKDELWDAGGAHADAVYPVSKLSAGYMYDFPSALGARVGAGLLGSVHILPGELEDVYGSLPLSLQVFVRAKL